ncbi:VOC family protein [bacterium]|nr:VOC family protein [bacterium]
MENGICHFELLVKDVAAAKEFYGGLFGWEFTDSFDGYVTIKAADGIGGGMYAPEKVPDDGPANLYVQVADIDDCLAKATAAGATVEMPKHTISLEHGAIAFFRDPDGLKMGIWSPK